MKKGRKKLALSIYLPSALLKFIDDQIAEEMYGSRSEYIADLIRKTMEQKNKEHGRI